TVARTIATRLATANGSLLRLLPSPWRVPPPRAAPGPGCLGLFVRCHHQRASCKGRACAEHGPCLGCSRFAGCMRPPDDYEAAPSGWLREFLPCLTVPAGAVSSARSV